jgi:hypothetical protein
MSDKAAVYDLGELDMPEQRPEKGPPPVVNRSARPLGEMSMRAAGNAGQTWLSGAWSVSFAMFLPGSSHILRGDLRRGLFYLASLGFLGALCWAILGTLDRLSATFTLFGLPSEIGPWVLGAIFIIAAVTYISNVCSAAPAPAEYDPQRAPAPLVSGIASLVVPGWGQAIAGHRMRAALFLSGCWLVGGAWIMVSPLMQAMLDSQGLVLPKSLELLVSPLVRWTLPAILWTIAVYDAVFQATLRR